MSLCVSAGYCCHSGTNLYGLEENTGKAIVVCKVHFKLKKFMICGDYDRSTLKIKQTLLRLDGRSRHLLVKGTYINDGLVKRMSHKYCDSYVRQQVFRDQGSQIIRTLVQNAIYCYNEELVIWVLLG